MGHIINPIRYRLGTSIFWSNNWPAVEKTRYFLSYEIHQEMDQYFRSLLYKFRKLKVKKTRKGGLLVLRKIRHPKLYYSHVNVNLFGLNLDKIMVDVTLYDFFLDSYLTEALSPNSIEKPDAPFITKFLKKFNRYIGYDFYFKHKRILQQMTKAQFSSVIRKCRKKLGVLESIAMTKLQIFIEIYIEFIRRSLFSVFNDQTKIYNPRDILFQREKAILNRLSFARRMKVIDKYWTRKYSHTLPETKSLLTFDNYFTSEFYNLITPRNQQNIDPKERTDLATTSYLSHVKNYKNEITTRKLALVSFSDRMKRRFERALQKTNTVITKPPFFMKSNLNSPFRTFPFELPSQAHKDLYNKDLRERPLTTSQPLSKMPLFILEFCNQKTIDFLINIRNSIKSKKSINYIIQILQYLKVPYKPRLDNTKINKIKRITNPKLKFLIHLTKFIFYFEKNFATNEINNQFLVKALQFLDDVKTYNRLQYKYIKQSIKKSANHWLKYDLDPFFQKYIELRNFKKLYLNINLGMGAESDIDNDIIDAKFLTLYIKRLFKRNKFKIPDLQRTMYRSLSRLPYIDGFVIIFAGRFTRRESKIHKVSRGGVFHYGAIDKLVDYHTIGFVNKFGYCGVKVFLQYKSNWPTLEHRDQETIRLSKGSSHKINTLIEPITNSYIISEIERLKPSSKRYTRFIQNLFSKNQIPYYGQN